MSATNKQNAAKKKLHHRTGSGGYLVARPKWAKTENDLVDKGIEPQLTGQTVAGLGSSGLAEPWTL